METDWEKLKQSLKRRGWDTDVIVHEKLHNNQDPSPRVLIAESNIERFIPSLFKYAMKGSHIFLGNPKWGSDRWREAITLVNPHLCIGDIPNEGVIDYKQNEDLEALYSEDGPLLMIPTGGSTAGLRFTMHGWKHFVISVHAFQTHFEAMKINNCCVLPHYHAGGFMQIMRSILTEGSLEFPSWSGIKEGRFPAFDPAEFFISLVPTQLWQLLSHTPAVDWLKQFNTVLLGGGAVSEQVLDKARSSRIRLAPSYGMTETAAMVSALKAKDFLNGKRGVGRPLPHAKIAIRDVRGNPVERGSPGRIIVKTKTLSHGYYPDINLPVSDEFNTGDEGYFDEEGCLHILGRLDRVIITGGEKVDPLEVEAAMFATGLIRDVWVLGRADPEWGQRVIVVYVPIDEEISDECIKTQLRDKLSSHQMPKSWIALKAIPRNAAGKIEIDQIDLF